MIIKTRDFGNIKAEDDDLINFTNGIYGFEEYKNYILLQDDPEDTIMYLQSVENDSLSFITVDPYAVLQGYRPVVTKEDLEELKVKKESDLRFLVISIITEKIQDSVVNLKSPIAINPQLKIAKQVIVQNQYPLRYKLFDSEEADVCL